MSRPEVFEPSLRGRALAPTGSALVLAEWEAPGATDGERLYQAPLHRHVHEDEAWYVLDGTLGVRIGDDEVEVPAGGAAIVPAGAPHTFWNPRPDPVRYLLVMGATTNALIGAIHAASDRGDDAMRELFARYGTELLE